MTSEGWGRATQEVTVKQVNVPKITTSSWRVYSVWMRDFTPPVALPLGCDLLKWDQLRKEKKTRKKNHILPLLTQQ